LIDGDPLAAVKRRPSQRFVVLASDGLWDVIASRHDTLATPSMLLRAQKHRHDFHSTVVGNGRGLLLTAVVHR